MNLILSVLLAALFLGLPFYWGSLGHNGLAIPILWAVAIAVVVNLRRWRNLERKMIPSLLVTLVLSLVASTAVFALGRALSR